MRYTMNTSNFITHLVVVVEVDVVVVVVGTTS